MLNKPLNPSCGQYWYTRFSILDLSVDIIITPKTKFSFRHFLFPIRRKFPNETAVYCYSLFWAVFVNLSMSDVNFREEELAAGDNGHKL